MSRPRFFPPPETADADGVVVMGGKLTPEWLLDAYSHGIFPWPYVHGREVLLWFSPDPRAVIELDQFHISRRLGQTLRSGKFVVTYNTSFSAVMRGCATDNGRVDATWITDSMISAYTRLHEMGYAHSVEVWHDGELAGGTYGIAIGGVYAGESMFYRVRDASKVALAHLVQRLKDTGMQLFDIQQLTPHTERLGASEISRSSYLRRLHSALELPVKFEP